MPVHCNQWGVKDEVFGANGRYDYAVAMLDARGGFNAPTEVHTSMDGRGGQAHIIPHTAHAIRDDESPTRDTRARDEW